MRASSLSGDPCSPASPPKAKMLSQRKLVLKPVLILILVPVPVPVLKLVVLLVLVFEILDFHGSLPLWVLAMVILGLSIVTDKVGRWADNVWVQKMRARSSKQFRVRAGVELAVVAQRKWAVAAGEVAVGARRKAVVVEGEAVVMVVVVTAVAMMLC